MPWIELHIKTTSAHAEPLSQHLTECNAVAITFQDAGDHPIYEPDPGSSALWAETTLIALFEQDASFVEIIPYLENQQAKNHLQAFHFKSLADQPWERICLEQFKPISFGKRLWICPSWHKPVDQSAINIILDPGLAFGTGSHPTTALCLEWLDTHIKGNEYVLDYGCGSGILGIAALKLGAKRVFAIDHDPQALEATKQNSARNKLNELDALTTYFPNQISELPISDLLIANILAEPLIQLAPLFSRYTKPNARIVLSGILPSQIDKIKLAYEPWFTLEKSITKQDWVLISGVRKNIP